jgi:hypothetical protein
VEEVFKLLTISQWLQLIPLIPSIVASLEAAQKDVSPTLAKVLVIVDEGKAAGKDQSTAEVAAATQIHAALRPNGPEHG